MSAESSTPTVGPVRIGMIGGGPGAFIGGVHRMAMALDGRYQLIAGAFSSSPEKSQETGRELGLNPWRVYGSWQQMLASEAGLPKEQRIEAVSIVTPNHVHHGPSVAALHAGFHVICDKPLTISSALADEIVAAAKSSDCLFALTHNYTGYPMIREARELVQSGGIGRVLKVYAEYLQGWLVDPIEESGHKQAAWRTDPSRSGPGGALGDIGTHAFHLLEHVSGERVTRLFGHRSSFVPTRKVDDDAMVLLEFADGATGTLTASQVCTGRENGLRLRIYGTEGGIEWEQENPNDLRVLKKDGAFEVRRPGNAYVGAGAASLTRLPGGHPEGYLEGFANIYTAFARAIRGEENLDHPYPTVEEGQRGVLFIESVIASSEQAKWVQL
ncbi:MAG: Gfo/Idh/MocA family oxidoreductase [Planctomycetota bacterium]|nr:Gfo/Idh/MocA family oxidoreductase [Planctomycetota bacterium]MDA1114803.1 Gfo/Idh/MocA family oxidoreductase [Planctomycetota bacterium]